MGDHRGELRQKRIRTTILTSVSRSKPKQSLLVSPTFRLALSLSSILFLHRFLHRFFIRLRLRLLKEKASQLCVRYPHLFRGLTSRIAPAMGASVAGFALSIYPSDQLRITAAIYIAARAVEMLYNALESDGYLGKVPWWFGSWMLFSLAQGQLLHAFVFDRDCFPKVETLSSETYRVLNFYIRSMAISFSNIPQITSRKDQQMWHNRCDGPWLTRSLILSAKWRDYGGRECWVNLAL